MLKDNLLMLRTVNGMSQGMQPGQREYQDRRMRNGKRGRLFPTLKSVLCLQDITEEQLMLL